MNYIEVNRKVTRKLLKKFEKEGIGEGRVNRYKRLSELLEKFADNKKSLLEIGVRCGWLFDFLDGFEDVYGIDISDYAIRKLHERGYEGEVQNAQNFELNKKFGTIVISHCLEHCPNPSKVIKNIDGHLELNGILVVEVPQQPKENVPTEGGHYYCFSSPKELLEFFSEEKWNLLYNEQYKKSMTFVFRRRSI